MSYNRLLYHIVITPWRREAIINQEHEGLLYKFIYDISIRQGAKIWRIGGMPDHVHILCELPTKLSVAAFFQHIKSESSKYLKYSSNFANWKKWGRIFGCFTVDYETRDRRIDYIKNQRIHHATRSFEDEFREMLNINGFSDETVLELPVKSSPCRRYNCHCRTGRTIRTSRTFRTSGTFGAVKQ